MLDDVLLKFNDSLFNPYTSSIGLNIYVPKTKMAVHLATSLVNFGRKSVDYDENLLMMLCSKELNVLYHSFVLKGTLVAFNLL